MVFTNKVWKMVTLAISCEKNERPTKGEDMAEAIEAVNNHGLTGRVVMGNTDCGPSMVKAGHLLPESIVFKHWVRVPQT